jgi:hypothetical protein
MLFLVTWKGRPETRNTAIARFLKTGGRPPQGVTMIGRWHAVGAASGVAVAEATDPTLVQKWALEWTDVFELEVRPALTDEQAGPLLAAVVQG